MEPSKSHREKSEKEIEQEFVSKYGDHRGKFLSKIRNEIFTIIYYYNFYTSLYGYDLDKIARMKAVDGEFFSQVQNLLLQNLIIRISRITDRPNNGKNITIASLPEMFKDKISFDYHEVKSKLSEIIHREKKEKGGNKEFGIAADIRTTRNKLIGHLDYEYTLGGKTFFTQENINAIEKTVMLLKELINDLYKALGMNELCFSSLVPNSPQKVLMLAENGLKYDELLLKIKKEGHVKANDVLDY